MVTLHGYILRDLLKTFALTLIALTAMFTMGGGLYNVLKHEGVGVTDILTFLPMLVPIVLALVMPVAALFAVAMVYGRLAADNELLACRASGINVHRLFLAALLLSVFVAGFDLMFSDLIVPQLTQRLAQNIKTNLRDFAYNKLQVAGYVRYDRRGPDDRAGERILLTAEQVQIPTDEALRAKNLPTGEGLSYLLVRAPRVLHIDEDDRVLQFTTARYGLCQFDTRTARLTATLYVDQARDFDVRGRSMRLQGQPLGPFELPIAFPRKASMVDLRTLLRWKKQPWLSDVIHEKLEGFRELLRADWLTQFCLERVVHGASVQLQSDEGDEYTLTAASGDVVDKGLRLHDVRLQKAGGDPARPYYFTAPLALVKTRRTLEERLMIELRLEESGREPVREHNPRSSDYQAGRTMISYVPTARFEVPAEVQQKVTELSDAVLLNPDTPLHLGEKLNQGRERLIADAQNEQRKVACAINFRLGYASSILVTAIMAAALGVIFRGSAALAAFALGCVPLFAVGLLMVMGQQLGGKPGKEFMSPLLTWGGLGVIAIADLIILRVGVRR